MTDDLATLDPLRAWGPRRLRRLARQASRRRMRGQEAFTDLAARADLDGRRLRLLADAWDEGGRAGIDVLGPAAEGTDLAVEVAAMQQWCASHFPLELLRWDAWRNRATLWHVVSAGDPREPPEDVPVAQLRRSRGGRWHVYRKAAQGEWWPVIVNGGRRPQDLAGSLEAVRVDPGGRFWRHAGGAGGPR